MPNNKKHHYVPKFYLKRFSENDKNISLYNLKNRKLIHGAALKSQCYQDYFYGKELDIEYSLGNIENEIAKIFLLIDKAKCLPPFGNPDHIMLILFISIQQGRTKYTADSLNEMTNKLFQYLDSKGDSSAFNDNAIGITNIAKFSVSISAEHYPLLLDLNYKLLKNQTKEGFITSDNPIVMYNQFLSFRNKVSNTGLTSKGLQIFLPIDNKNMIMLFDSNIYSVGGEREIVVELTKEQDIYELNTLQVCSCSENIYFKDKELNILALYKKAKPYLRTIKTNFAVFPNKQESKKGKKSEFLVSAREDIKTNLKLSFVNIKRSAKKWLVSFKKQKAQPSVVVRNQKLYNEQKEFIELVKYKKYLPNEFFKFIHEKS